MRERRETCSGRRQTGFKNRFPLMLNTGALSRLYSSIGRMELSFFCRGISLT